MDIEWAEVKAFYFRNENVILRVPFCFFLQLAAHFDKTVKESDENTKTWYEIAGKRQAIFSFHRRQWFRFEHALVVFKHNFSSSG